MNDMTDKEMIFRALNMWANYVETGDVCLSSQDAKNCGMPQKIKALDTEQMKMVIRIKDLSGTILRG